MNGRLPPKPVSAWKEVADDQGRTYYHNTVTNEVTWTKPEEMMTPVERYVANTDPTWKELGTDGKKYWLNTATNTTTWDMPEVFKQAYAMFSEPSGGRAEIPYHHQNGRSNRHHEHPREYRDTYPDTRQITYPNDPNAQAFVPASDEPEYASQEEAEAAFSKLLKRSGVQPDWTWEQTVRATARDPQFRAIKDPRERKIAFQKYCDDLVIQDKERAKERMAKLRIDFQTMLKSHPEITHYTRWKTALPIIEGETIFRSTNSETERRQLFDEYIVGAKRAHAEQKATTRRSAIDGLVDLLPKLNLEPYTRWADAQNAIKSTESFQSDDKYTSLNNFDILIAFQNHMKAIERAFNDSRQAAKNLRFRNERKARDGFRDLLNDLRQSGKINPGTKWSTIVPLIEQDDRYVNMAGQAGSSPLTLFWDVIEEEERGLRGPRNAVLDVLEDKKSDVASISDVEEFLSLLKEDRRTANIPRDVLILIYNRLREKRTARREDIRQPDRHQRHAIDDFRAYMRRVDPPITLSDTYDKVRTRLLKSAEFQAVSSEEWRQGAFEKHQRRLREREGDADRRDHRRRDRASVEQDHHRRERERDGSRGERSHRSSGRAPRRSRSPEPDAYEADRRKAIAQRESNYRKSAMAEGLLTSDRNRLTSPRRDRERDREHGRDRERERERVRDKEKERDVDRPPRSRRDDDSHYERERRDREEERERQYRRRTDRGSYEELPYGDEHQSAPRRRRPDDEEDYAKKNSREPKRVKRERSGEQVPQTQERETKEVKPTTPVTKDVHSGSEEGEIEEED